MPYKFTGKERDEETGLYYFGARYLDAKYSRWISTDPALLSYVSGSSAGGGIYNSINFNLYHYGGNNPVRYSDPTGLFDWDTNTIQEGDTLSQIAKDCNTRYGTNYTADDLQGLNSDTISDKDKIYAGNHLNLGKAEDVQKRVADYTSRATTQYSNEQVTPSPLTTLNTNSGPSKAKIASTLGDIAAVLSVANAICFFACPAACPFITATCFALDAVSAGLYMSEGDSKSAALAMTSVALDSFGLASSIKPIARMIPSQVRLGYNSGAHQFIQGNGRFIKTAVGVVGYMMEDVLIPGGMYIYGKTSGN